MVLYLIKNIRNTLFYSFKLHTQGVVVLLKLIAQLDVLIPLSATLLRFGLILLAQEIKIAYQKGIVSQAKSIAKKTILDTWVCNRQTVFRLI